MYSEGFKAWLEGQPSLQPGSQVSALTRCSRVERLTGLDLNDVVSSDAKMSDLFRWLAEHAADYIDGEQLENGASCLMSAVRTYAEFRRDTQTQAASGSR